MSATLLVLVPLLLLPVVGLLAFAGCVGEDPQPVAPTPAPGPGPGPGPTPDPTPKPKPEGPSYLEVVRSTIGLVAYWPLDDADGARLARDEGPSGLSGRYVDGPPDVERAKPGGALAPRVPDDRCAGFPGDKAHVAIDHSPKLNPAGMLPRFSFEVWARLRNPSAREGMSEHLASSRVYAADTDPTGGWDLYVTYGPGGVPTFTARVFAGTGQSSTSAAVEARSGSTPPGGAWHHVVMTYDGRDGGTVGVYVRLAGEDALYPKTESPAPYDPNPNVPLRLGAAATSVLYNLFEGDLDQAAFYDAVLTTTDLAAHHKAAQAQA